MLGENENVEADGINVVTKFEDFQLDAVNKVVGSALTSTNLGVSNDENAVLYANLSADGEVIGLTLEGADEDNLLSVDRGVQNGGVFIGQDDDGNDEKWRAGDARYYIWRENDGYGFVSRPRDQNEVGLVNNRTRGWNYQAFGVWEKDPGAGDSYITAASFGSEVTPEAVFNNLALGNVGNDAKYTGIFNGVLNFLDNNNNNQQTTYLTKGDIDIEVDFDASTFDLGTSNEEYGALNNNTGSVTWTNQNDDGVDFSLAANLIPFNAANGSFDDNNLLFMDINDPNLMGTGRIAGKFFGPNAEEIGGTFDVRDNGANQNMIHIGAFGAAEVNINGVP